MFERYSEKALRAVYFAREEAGNPGSKHVGVPHLLLGLMRESPFVRGLLKPSAADTLRDLLRQQSGGPPLATSVDLPLSEEAKQMLDLAAEEADVRNHQQVDCPHFFAAFLRLPPSETHAVLKMQTGELDALRQEVHRHLESEKGFLGTS